MAGLGRTRKVRPVPRRTATTTNSSMRAITTLRATEPEMEENFLFLAKEPRSE